MLPRSFVSLPVRIRSGTWKPPKRWASMYPVCLPADAGKVLADRITWFMQRLKLPNGLRAMGYTSSDIPALVEGTLPQHRVTKLSPRPAGPEELARLFEDALVAY